MGNSCDFGIMQVTPTHFFTLLKLTSSTKIGSGLLDIRELFFNDEYIEKYSSVFDHGCHCSRIINDKVTFSGEIVLASSPGVVDSVDQVCKKWIMKRRCLNSPGGSCFETKSSYDVDMIANCDLLKNECARASCLVDQASLVKLDEELAVSFDFAIKGDPMCYMKHTSVDAKKPEFIDMEHGAFKTMTEKVCYGEAPEVSFQDPDAEHNSLRSTPQEPQFCLDKVDLVFALDGSGSLSMLDFQIQKDFVFNVIDGLKISPENTRVAIVQYNKNIRTEFSFISEELELINNVFALRQWGVRCRSCSRVGLAYDYIIENLYPHKRPDAQMRIIALSDGYTKSSDDSKRLTSMRFFQENSVPVYYIAVQDCDNICNVCRPQNCPKNQVLNGNHVSSGPDFNWRTSTKGWTGLRELKGVKESLCNFRNDEFSPSIEDDNPFLQKTFSEEVAEQTEELDDQYDDYYDF